MWTCRRQQDKVRCGHVNSNRLHLCGRCGKRRAPRKRPAHLAALDLPYERFVELNGGDFCAICGKKPEPGRKLHRDHEHKGTGRPRGLLCFPCNLQLKHTSTASWLRAAAAYLERTSGGSGKMAA